MSGWQVKLCDPLAITAISERFSDEVHDETLYKLTTLYFIFFPPVLIEIKQHQLTNTYNSGATF